MTRSTSGFMASSGTMRNSSVVIVPLLSLSSFWNRLYNRFKSFWEKLEIACISASSSGESADELAPIFFAEVSAVLFFFFFPSLLV
eukprot:21598_5